MAFPRIELRARPQPPKSDEQVLIDRRDSAQADFDEAKTKAEGARSNAERLATDVDSQIDQLTAKAAECQTGADRLWADAKKLVDQSQLLPVNDSAGRRSLEDQARVLLQRRSTLLRGKAQFERTIRDDLGQQKVAIQQLEADAAALDRTKVRTEAQLTAAKRSLDDFYEAREAQSAALTKAGMTPQAG
jgi:hypothetical protein